MLRHHGRYEYAPITRRPSFAWPRGRGLAVYVALNLEQYAFGEGLAESIVPSLDAHDVLNYSWREYGNRVGAWRLRDMFSQLGIPLSVLVNTELYGHCPDLVRAFGERGDEIVAHGRTNSEAQSGLDEAAERALIDDATSAILRHEGAAPQGWLGPWISETPRTPDLLYEAGYRYVLDWCGDDQPVWMATRRGRILAVPYPQELNDSNAIVARHMNASDFADAIVDQFDEMREQGESQPLVMGVALHAYIAGQPFRLRHLRRAFAHIARERDAIWLSTAGAVAAHYAARVPAPGSPP
ncbi:MAG: polysaccharide deacetylase family protein [Burkholderiales bacterium]